MSGELVVLGTSAERPNRYRSPNGYVLRYGAHTVLLDPGEGSLRQLSLVGIPATDITHILISHFHLDHYLGLPSVLEIFVTDGLSHLVEIYFPISGRSIIDYLLVLTGATVLTATRLQLKPVPEEGLTHTAEELTLAAVPLAHSVPTIGYRLVVRGITPPSDDGSVHDGDAVFAFVMDTALCDNASWLARGADLLLCEATYLENQTQLAKAQQHMTALQAGTLAREAGAKRLLLTHFSHRHAEVNAFLHEARRSFHRADVARDNCRYTFERVAED
jgi:ribonuclease Z